MRRQGPRPLAPALDALVASTRPATLLARVQAAWTEAAGPGVAAEAEPVSERGGVITVACHSAVWAQELELLGPDLVERVREAIGEGPGDGALPRGLRFVAGGRPPRA